MTQFTFPNVTAAAVENLKQQLAANHDTIDGAGTPENPYVITDQLLTVSAVYDGSQLVVTVVKKKWYIPVSVVQSELASHLGVSQ